MSTTMKLTDTHFVILAHAAQRPDGCVLPLPSSLKAKGGAITSILRSLLRRGLIAEQPASPGEEEWCRDEAGVPMALVIAPAGLSAVGLASDETQAEAPDSEDGTSRAESAQPDGNDGLILGRPTAFSDAGQRTETKAATLMALIERDAGATLVELMAASGWQAHSVRGFLSGTLKKRLGRAIVSDRRDDGARRYRIAG